MQKTPICLLIAACAAAALTLNPSGGGLRAEDGYGSISGQFVLDGDVPKPVLEFAKGDPKVKDGEVCAANDRFSNTLVIDEKTKGIANIFVYLRSAPSIHPDLANSKVKEEIFDQKGCQFMPHALFVRTDQAVRVLSNDPVAHNTHTHPLFNQATNFLLKPNDRKGIPVSFTKAEFLPTKVTCDIHPFMTAYWMVLDHPYAAITDAEGKFTMTKLPAGEHEFRVWHERSGWVPADGWKFGFKETIVSGNDDLELKPFKIPMSEFEE